MRRSLARPPATWVIFVLLAACMPRLRSKGGGQLDDRSAPRRISAADVAVPSGYRVEAVAEGLTFPTGVAFDDHGQPYVVESGYAYGEVFTTPRLLRVREGGRTDVVTEGERNGPWNGVAFADGAFFVSEGGELVSYLLRLRHTGG